MSFFSPSQFQTIKDIKQVTELLHERASLKALIKELRLENTKVVFLQPILIRRVRVL